MITAFLFAAALFCACGPDEPAEQPGGKPVANVILGSVGNNFVEFELKLIHASSAWLLPLPETSAAPSAADVKASGKAFEPGKSSLSGLQPGTSYTLYYCPESEKGALGSVSTASFRTLNAEPYAWEKERDGIPFFADLALIYGGSTRTPRYWDKARIASHVTWTDPNTKEEKWLFDAFLALDMRNMDYNDPRALAIGIKDWSDNSIPMKAGRQQEAIEWLDYWFSEGNGFVALNEAVGDAISRIGPPPVSRKVIVMMPDIPAHERYNIMTSSTKYWGSVDGRELDFSNPADRVAAYCWFVDEVRARFSKAAFQNIELGGFYIMSEEIASMRSGEGGHGGDLIDGQMRDGWEVEAKAWDEVFPAVSNYIHLYNEAVVWIPYRCAAGFRYWQDFGIDYAYMQPNRFWDTNNVNPMSSFFYQISTYKLNMELEIDDRVMRHPVDQADSSYKEGEDYNTYRARWREYIDGMQNAEVYGYKQLACYLGGDSFNNIKNSSDYEERALFNEFCRLIAEDPLKAKNK
ncbi:MAG: DUF4855 domain-containing protein [Bacteroidales bacterium]|nr:DUF4855 domain-containing protein [Bacteroidales bacterium]